MGGTPFFQENVIKIDGRNRRHDILIFEKVESKLSSASSKWLSGLFSAIFQLHSGHFPNDRKFFQN